MSRVGKKQIPLPKGVQVTYQNGKVKVVGPKGNLEQPVHPTMDIKIVDGTLNIEPKKGQELADISQYFGLTRSTVANMVHGVTEGFTKSLTLVGVGYRASQAGKNITLSLGYSHPIEFTPP